MVLAFRFAGIAGESLPIAQGERLLFHGVKGASLQHPDMLSIIQTECQLLREENG